MAFRFRVASYAVVLRLVTRGEERVTSLRTSAWEASFRVDPDNILKTELYENDNVTIIT